MPRTWRGALIGCGFFASNQMHAWQSVPNVSIVALCDRDLAKANAMGKEFGVHAIFDNAAAMLDRVPLDFVDIVTTVESHRSLVELGARHGKLVVCQKPFAETLADADAMIAACREADVPLIVHENFRWQRPFLEITERIAHGAIGQVASLRLTFHHAHDIYSNQPYLKDVERLAIMDVGLHLFDLARVFAGDVESITCESSRLNPDVRGEDTFLATLRHQGGAASVIDCSFFSHAEVDLFPQTLAIIQGTKGLLELGPDYRLRCQAGDTSAEDSVEPEVPAWGRKPLHSVQDSVINFQRHVVEVLEGRAEPRPSGAHNRDTLALALAAYESAAAGKSVAPRGRTT